MVPLASLAGHNVQCRLSSRIATVLMLLLAHMITGMAATSLQFSAGGEDRQAATALAQVAAWEEETPQPKNQCTKDSDCSWHAQCGAATRKCEVMPLGEMIGADIFMCLLAFVIAGFSLAAGVGGGGLYVPLLMFILSFDTRVATALSQAMLFGGAFAAFVYNVQMSHPTRPERPLINFQLALLMAPALMGGAQVGSVIHALAPPVLTLLLLLLVLSDAAKKGINNAIKVSAKEDKEEAPAPVDAAYALETAPSDEGDEKVCARSRTTRTQLLLVWLLCIALVATKGLLFEMCTPVWWLLTAATATVLTGLSWKFAGTLSEQEPVDADDIDFRQNAYPIAKMSIIAGVIAAMCGIGGGMVMGPILVELKVPPPVSAATTATTLVVLSTSTLLIYICRGMAPPEYAICLSLFTMMGAACGKVVCAWWIKKTGKQSVIIWVLAAVTIASMCLMTIEGLLTFAREPQKAVAIRDFCGGHIHHTVPATD